MEWRACAKSASWRQRLAHFDEAGRCHMRVREDEECDEQDGDSEERELVAAAFAPVEGGEKWKHKWDGVWEKAVEVQEVRKYLRGKADSSSPGPSLMRYGHIRHGSEAMLAAIAGQPRAPSWCCRVPRASLLISEEAAASLAEQVMEAFTEKEEQAQQPRR